MRLSYSTLNAIHSCPRRLQLNKLAVDKPEGIILDSQTNNEHLDFGSAFGIGAQHYFMHNDLERAQFEALRAYNFVERGPKCMEGLMLAIEALTPIPNVYTLSSGRIAEEVSFKIILDSHTEDYYCGYIDLIIQEPSTGLVYPVDFKTTGVMRDNLLPAYLNSDQLPSYSCVLDTCLPGLTTYQNMYIVAQFKKSIIPAIKPIVCNKLPQDKLEWLINLQLDYNQLIQYQELGFYPKRGNSCLAFNRICPYFQLCDMESLTSQLEWPEVVQESWDFVYHIDDLIATTTEQVANYQPTKQVELELPHTENLEIII